AARTPTAQPSGNGITTPGCTRKVVGRVLGWTSGTNSKSKTTGDQLGFTPKPNGKLTLKFSAMVVGLEAPGADVKVARVPARSASASNSSYLYKDVHLNGE